MNTNYYLPDAQFGIEDSELYRATLLALLIMSKNA